MRRLKSWDTVAIAVLVAWPCLYYWPVTVGQRIFSEGDINWLFLPIRTELSRALAQGRLPLWSPGLEAGFPLFAEGEVAALYPINLLFHWLLPAPSALSYSILFNLIWASVGMYLLVRSSGFRVPSALLAGFVFGFNGFAAAQISHVPHMAVASWLPWLLLLQQKYWQASSERKRTLVWLMLLALAIALQLLAGFPQFAFLNIAALFFFGIFAPVLVRYREDDHADWKRTLVSSLPRTVPATIAPVVIGVAIAAVQLVPTVELIGFSIRAQELSQSFFTSYSLPPLALSQFVSPFWYLGIPDATNMEYYAYLGVLVLLLAVAAPALRRDARTGLLVFCALVALSLALGDSNPVYEWLYYVPVFNRFRVPARFLLYFIFAAAFLAATGFEELQDRLRDSRGPNVARQVIAICSILAVAAVVALAYLEPIDIWMQAWNLLPMLLAALGLAVLGIGILRIADRSVFVSLVLGLTMVDLGLATAPFLSRLAQMSPPNDLTEVPRTVLAMDNTNPIYRVIVDKHPLTPASIRAALWTNLPLIYGKQGVRAYLPSLGLLRNQEYIDDMTLPMRDLMNIRYYLLPVEIPDYANSLPLPFDTSEPFGGLSLDVLTAGVNIPPTRAGALELVSYTDGTANMPDGTLVGELSLMSDTGQTVNLPIRLGIETADWALDGLGKTQHDKPKTVLSFPAYLKSIGHPFDGHKYVMRYDLKQANTLLTVTSLRVRSFLPGVGLNIERISFIDDTGHVVSLATLLDRTELSLVFRSHTTAMWENLDVLPRAFVIHDAESVKDENALARMKQPDFRPDRVVLIDGDINPTQEAGSMQPTASDQTAIIQYDSDHVVVKVTATSAGYLVLTDSWYPGWDAWVDGKSVPIVRADYIFRAVWLQPGEHTVVFEYHPLSFAVGAAISGLSILACGVFAFWSKTRVSESNGASRD